MRRNRDATAFESKKELPNVSCFRSRPKNSRPAIRTPGQGLRGGMASTWLADRFYENLEARARLRKGTYFYAGRRSGPKASGTGWSPQDKGLENI